MKKVIILGIIVLFSLSHANWEKVGSVNAGSGSIRMNFGRMFFIDTLHGWLAGGSISPQPRYNQPYLARTYDGGKIWTEQLTDSRTAYIWDICFVNNNIGWMASQSRQSYGDSIGLIYKTEDGGLNWQLVLEG